MVQMVSVDKPDVPLTVSICSFAVSIPSLSAIFLCLMVQTQYGITEGSERLERLLRVFTLVGSLASVVGFSAIFFHFAIYAGIAFIAVSVAGLMLWMRCFQDLFTQKLSLDLSSVSQLSENAKPESTLPASENRTSPDQR